MTKSTLRQNSRESSTPKSYSRNRPAQSPLVPSSSNRHNSTLCMALVTRPQLLATSKQLHYKPSNTSRTRVSQKPLPPLRNWTKRTHSTHPYTHTHNATCASSKAFSIAIASSPSTRSLVIQVSSAGPKPRQRTLYDHCFRDDFAFGFARLLSKTSSRK